MAVAFLRNNLTLDCHTDMLLKCLSIQYKKNRSQIVRELILERAQNEEGFVQSVYENIKNNKTLTAPIEE